MSFDHTLKHKLNQRVDSFISEINPSDGNFFTYSELMHQFQNSLEEFSNQVYGEENKDFIEEQQKELDEGISPTVRDMTDGADEIISSLLVIEIAKIIYQDGINEEEFSKKRYRPELDDGREAIFRATRYLYPDIDSGPHKKVLNKLGDYIYRNKSTNEFSSSSGCMVSVIFIIASISTLLAFI